MGTFTHLIAILVSMFAPPAPADCVGRCWSPAPGSTLWWQLSGRIDPAGIPTDIDVIDIDAETPPSVVRALQRRGQRVVCYVSAGSWEEFRGDAGSFPAAVRGEPLDGWPGEAWLDVRALDVLEPILRRRIAACARAGFDGIEFDNVDGFANDTGFEIAATDQLRVNRWLADEAHRHGLAAVLKNDPDQVRALEPWFDAALAEQCVQFDECDAYAPFVDAGKPVWDAEYELPIERICPVARRAGVNAARYPLDLDGGRIPCTGA